MWLHFYDILEKANLQGQKIHQWSPGAGGGRSGWTSKEPEGMFWSDGNTTLISVLVTRLCTFVKIH